MPELRHIKILTFSAFISLYEGKYVQSKKLIQSVQEYPGVFWLEMSNLVIVTLSIQTDKIGLYVITTIMCLHINHYATTISHL